MPDVLFVCTANVCRSPLAERLLRYGLDAAALGSSGPLTVASAGVRARERSPMAANAALVLRRRGASDAEFASRRLVPQTFGNPALVLTAERWHRRAVVEAQPRLLRRSFTLLEFARLLALGDAPGTASETPRERVVALANAAAAHRGSGVATDGGLDDLPDPIGGTLAEFEECADRIQGGLGVLLRALAPTLQRTPTTAASFAPAD